MAAAIQDNNPVVFIDDRWLHNEEGSVPENVYSTPIGKARVLREGTDLTIIAASYMVTLACQAVERLSQEGVRAELIDLRSIKPYDKETLIASVRKTGRAPVVDPGWRTYGMAAELAATIQESAFEALKSSVARLCLPDAPAPASRTLEHAYYPTADTILEQARKMMGHG